MAKINFNEIERDLTRTRDTISRTQTADAAVQEKLGRVLKGGKLADLKLNIEDADFEAVAENQKIVEENIASMIFGLDEITQSFGTEFKSMSEESTGEKLIGFFSRKKAAEMRSSRVRNADIRGSLAQLIKKSDIIATILNEQRVVLSDKLTKNTASQASVLERARETAREIERLNGEIAAVTPKIASLDARIAEAVGEERRKLEAERTTLVNQHNELASSLQSRTAEGQSLEKYASQYANYVQSLTNQLAAQETLISKLKLDTEQRSVLYDTVAESLRTAQQQDVAHRIVEVGAETDNQAETMMAQIGASSANKVAGMLEAHAEYMRKTEAIRAKGAEAEAEFGRRFSAIAAKMNKGRYGGDAA